MIFFRISFFWVFCIAQMFLILLLIMCGNVFNIFLFLYFYIFFWILFFLSFLYYVLDCFLCFSESICVVFLNYGHMVIMVIDIYVLYCTFLYIILWSLWPYGHDLNGAMDTSVELPEEVYKGMYYKALFVLQILVKKSKFVLQCHTSI